MRLLYRRRHQEKPAACLSKQRVSQNRREWVLHGHPGAITCWPRKGFTLLPSGTFGMDLWPVTVTSHREKLLTFQRVLSQPAQNTLRFLAENVGPRQMLSQQIQQLLREAPFWYSTIELDHDVWSPGLSIPTVTHPRQMLRSLDLRGLNCVDIGCVEGLLSVLMLRQGAASVVAYDRVDWTRKVDFVRSRYDAPFTYITGVNYQAFQRQVRNLPQYPFDIVNFSGVLYHMFDPVGGLLRTRSLVRDGGLVIVETSALFRSEDAIYFNNEGKILGPPNYCFPTLAWLDFVLRLCRLSPLDLIHTGRGWGHHPDHMRITILCRAVSEPMVYLSGEWDDHLVTDYADYLDWPWTQTVKPQVPHAVTAQRQLRQDGSMDILRTASQVMATPYPEKDIVLHLNDRS